MHFTAKFIRTIPIDTDVLLVKVFMFYTLQLIAFGKHYFMIFLNYIELMIVLISYIELILRETVFSKRGIASEEELYCYTGPVFVAMNAGYRKLAVISTVLLSTRFLRTFRLFEVNWLCIAVLLIK